MDCSTPGFPVHHQYLELTQTHVHWVGDAIQLSHPLSAPSPSTFNISQNQGILNEPVLRIRWPRYWSFSFSINPSKEYSKLFPLGLTWLISFQSKGLLRVFYCTTVQKDQFFGSQPSLWVQLSHPYMTTGKNIALCRQTFVTEVMSLLFNMLSRFVILFFQGANVF